MMHHNPARWTDEVRAQALEAVRIARASEPRVLGYYLRCALAHGVTTDDLCRAGNLSPELVAELTDPAAAA